MHDYTYDPEGRLVHYRVTPATPGSFPSDGGGNSASCVYDCEGGLITMKDGPGGPSEAVETGEKGSVCKT